MFHRLPGSQNHKRRPVIHQAGIGSRQQGSHGDFMLLQYVLSVNVFFYGQRSPVSCQQILHFFFREQFRHPGGQFRTHAVTDSFIAFTSKHGNHNFIQPVFLSGFFCQLVTAHCKCIQFLPCKAVLLTGSLCSFQHCFCAGRIRGKLGYGKAFFPITGICFCINTDRLHRRGLKSAGNQNVRHAAADFCHGQFNGSRRRSALHIDRQRRNRGRQTGLQRSQPRNISSRSHRVAAEQTVRLQHEGILCHDFL